MSIVRSLDRIYSPDQERARRKRRAPALAGVALCLLPSGCTGLFDSGPTMSETFVALGEKVNPCADMQPLDESNGKHYSIDPSGKACVKSRRKVSVAIVFPEKAGIDSKAYEKNLEAGYKIMTLGYGALNATLFPVEGQLAEDMTDGQCSSTEVERSEAVEAAVTDPDINSKDIVLALIPDTSCGDSADGVVLGTTFRRLGDRFIEVYRIPRIGSGDYSEELSETVSAEIHEIAHAKLDLGHASTTDLDLYLEATGEYNRKTINLTKLTPEMSIDTYGNDKSIMGSKYTTVTSHTKAWNLLSRVEVEDVASNFNERSRLTYLNTKDDYEILDSKHKRGYVYLDADLPWTNHKGEEKTLSGLMVYPGQRDKEKGVVLSTQMYVDGKFNVVELGFMPIYYGDVVTVVYKDSDGKQRKIHITSDGYDDDKFKIKVIK